MTRIVHRASYRRLTEPPRRGDDSGPVAHCGAAKAYWPQGGHSHALYYQTRRAMHAPNAVTAPHELPQYFRNEAQRLQKMRLLEAAGIFEYVAQEIERSFALWVNEPLPLSVASAESRVTKDALRKRVSEGRTPQAGSKGRPRIRRGDLPLPEGLNSLFRLPPQEDPASILDGILAPQEAA